METRINDTRIDGELFANRRERSSDVLAIFPRRQTRRFKRRANRRDSVQRPIRRRRALKFLVGDFRKFLDGKFRQAAIDQRVRQPNLPFERIVRAKRLPDGRRFRDLRRDVGGMRRLKQKRCRGERHEGE